MDMKNKISFLFLILCLLSVAAFAADKTELSSSGSTKIAGSNSSGQETGFIGEYNGQLRSADILGGNQQALKSVGTTAVEMKVGANNLANRKLLIIQAQSTGLKFGFSSASQPFDFPNGSMMQFSIGASVSVWVKKNSGTTNVAIAEFD